jgi:hypothetical protein
MQALGKSQNLNLGVDHDAEAVAERKLRWGWRIWLLLCAGVMLAPGVVSQFGFIVAACLATVGLAMVCEHRPNVQSDALGRLLLRMVFALGGFALPALWMGEPFLRLATVLAAILAVVALVGWHTTPDQHRLKQGTRILAYSYLATPALSLFSSPWVTVLWALMLTLYALAAVVWLFIGLRALRIAARPDIKRRTGKFA